jgi:hemerythrin
MKVNFPDYRKQSKGNTHMAFLEWNDSLSVGVKSIDDQHKQLVALVNTLHNAIANGEGGDALGKILVGLIDYTKTHFAYEEKLFSQTAYTESAAHKQEHDKFCETVLDVQAKFNGGAGEALHGQVMDFLKDWLITHIQGSDRKYGPHLTANGVK